MSAFSIDFAGGITNYLRTLASSQVAAGNEVFVLDGSPTDTWKMHDRGFMVKGSPNMQDDLFVVSLRKDPRGSASLVEEIISQNADVVHFHLTSGIGTDFYIAFAQLRIKYIVSLHDYYLFCPRVTMVDFTGNDCGGPELKKCARCISVLDRVDPLYRLSRKTGLRLPRIRSKRLKERNDKIAIFFKNATALLAVSTRVRDLYTLVYPEGKYIVSHIGTASAIETRPDKTESPKLRLTFIGTLAKFKGSEVLETIASKLTRDDVVVQFYGRVGSERARQRALRAGIELKGSYVPADLATIMSNTDVGMVLPVWEDNAPQVVMEFLNFGVFVFATRMGGIPDFVTPDNGYLFDHRNECEFLDAIHYLDKLDVDMIREISEKIPRLTNPDAHEKFVSAIYYSEK